MTFKSSDAQFTVPGDTITVAPKSKYDLQIKFAPTNAGSAMADITVTSNDPDSPAQTFKIGANGADVGGDRQRQRRGLPATRRPRPTAAAAARRRARRRRRAAGPASASSLSASRSPRAAAATQRRPESRLGMRGGPTVLLPPSAHDEYRARMVPRPCGLFSFCLGVLGRLAVREKENEEQECEWEWEWKSRREPYFRLLPNFAFPFLFLILFSQAMRPRLLCARGVVLPPRAARPRPASRQSRAERRLADEADPSAERAEPAQLAEEVRARRHAQPDHADADDRRDAHVLRAAQRAPRNTMITASSTWKIAATKSSRRAIVTTAGSFEKNSATSPPPSAKKSAAEGHEAHRDLQARSSRTASASSSRLLPRA